MSLQEFSLWLLCYINCVMAVYVCLCFFHKKVCMVCGIICNFFLLKLRAMAWGELWALLCATLHGYFMFSMYVCVVFVYH